MEGILTMPIQKIITTNTQPILKDMTSVADANLEDATPPHPVALPPRECVPLALHSPGLH